MCVSSRELLTYSKNIKYNLFEKLSVVTLLSAQEWVFNVNLSYNQLVNLTSISRIYLI